MLRRAPLFLSIACLAVGLRTLPGCGAETAPSSEPSAEPGKEEEEEDPETPGPGTDSDGGGITDRDSGTDAGKKGDAGNGSAEGPIGAPRYAAATATLARA